MDRYTRKDAEKAFERLIAAIGGRVAVNYKDVGAYRLDWNPTYGGGNIERIVSESGGVSLPFNAGRMNAKDFCNTVHFTIYAMGEKERNMPVNLDLQSKVYTEHKAHEVAEQLTKSHGGFYTYTVEAKDGFGRIRINATDDNRLVGYY